MSIEQTTGWDAGSVPHGLDGTTDPGRADARKRTVIIWSGLLLPASETFIRAQTGAMERFAPCFAGCRSVGKGSLIPAGDCHLVNRGGMTGAFSEAMFKSIGVAPSYRKKLSQCHPSLVHAHFGLSGALALPLANALGVPLVVTFHGSDATTDAHASRYSSLARWTFCRREDQLKRDTTLFIAVSEFIKRKLIERGYPPEKIVVHYIGVDTAEFQPDPTIAREPVVLFVGRLVEKKGCEYLIRAMERVQSALIHPKLVVIGDGPLRGFLQTLAQSKLRQATFMGSQPRDVVRRWMNRASFLVVPSVTALSGDSEGLPTVILEAQAMGLPVIATDHGGISEAVIHGETGLIASERDIDKLGEDMFRLCSDSSLRTRLAIGARRQVESKFDLHKQTKALESIYDGLL